MIAMVDATYQGANIFHYEFPLPDEGAVVGIPWAEGIKAAIDEFRKAHPGLSLWDVQLSFGQRP